MVYGFQEKITEAPEGKNVWNIDKWSAELCQDPTVPLN